MQVVSTTKRPEQKQKHGSKYLLRLSTYTVQILLNQTVKQTIWSDRF
jgi:hypothetical protein